MKTTIPNTDESQVSLLIVDDDPDSLDHLSTQLAQPGLGIVTVSDPEAGLDIACRCRPDVVLATPQPGGLEMLERIVEMDYAGHVVRLARRYSADGESADDALADLRERVGRLVREVRARRSLESEQPQPDPDFEGIVGNSPPIAAMFSRIRCIAPYYRTALITGETGTGKDLAARALHRLSPASKGRYVALNCSAVVDTLSESELFGHVKGSFTGAVYDKPGIFEHAHGGTLFLDEIGDMPLASQAKLLRVLQNREVQRVGAVTTRKVDVHVIAATNHDLRTLIAQKRFREDLYYRIAMVEIRLPRLADREEDLPLLQRHFIRRFAAEYKKEIRGLSAGATVRLARHSWPGNVRELENVIGYAAMMTAGDQIGAGDLPSYLQPNPEPVTLPATSAQNVGTFREHEREILLRALEAAGGNQSKAARLLRIGRDSLRSKLRKHNLEERDSAWEYIRAMDLYGYRRPDSGCGTNEYNAA